MVNLGPIALAQPRTMNLGAPRAYRMGQEEVSMDALTVRVLRDGVGAPGVSAEVMLMDRTEDVVTGPDGSVAVPYGAASYGMATVRITTPDDVRDMGEANVQSIDLPGGPAELVFEMLSIEEAPTKGRDAAVALAAAALLVLIGTSL